MIFVVSRSSDWLHDSVFAPCEGAVKDGLGYYTIEINTLEELIAFQDKMGCNIIIKRVYHDDRYGIEIYDDFRE